MKTNNSIKNVVVIGNFDGCHLGHHDLVTTALRIASKETLRTIALTFDPNPKVFMGSVEPQELIFTTEQRIRGLKEWGIEEVWVKHFDDNFMQMPPSLFYRNILHEECRAAVAVVGEDFHFGYQKSGNVDLLKGLMQSNDGSVISVPLLRLGDSPVKSSTIRSYLVERGDVANATNLLGHYFPLEGTIYKGRQLGRTLGIPTANLAEIHQLLPKSGVYAGYASFQSPGHHNFSLMKLENHALPAVINVGRRPTVSGDDNITVEAHLLTEGIGPNALYGMSAIYYFTHRLRDEVKFIDLHELKTQINRDIDNARRILL